MQEGEDRSGNAAVDATAASEQVCTATLAEQRDADHEFADLVRGVLDV